MIKLHHSEKVLIKIRKHWLVFVMEIFGLIVAALIPFVMLAIPLSFFEQILPDLDRGSIAALLGFLIAAWEFAVFITFMVILTTYYLDVVIVTNKRILDVDQVALFARDVAGVPIENLEDIKIETNGILAEIFHFGDLHIQSAAQAKEVAVKGIRHPARCRDMIMNAYHNYKHEPD